MANDQQRTDAWRADRRGKVTASIIKDICKRQKNGSFYAAREDQIYRIAHEILTGEASPGFTSPATDHGIANEQGGIDAYTATIWSATSMCGFIPHPTIDRAGASPDLLVGDDGQAEIKCPYNGAVHVETLLKGMPEDHKYQIQMQLACTGRQWCDFVSYDPRLSEEYRLYVQRIERDDLFISTMEEMIRKFLSDVDKTVDELREKYKEKNNVNDGK